MTKQPLVVPILNGDGISDEIMHATKFVVESILEARGRKVEWIELQMGEHALKEFGSPLPERNLSIIAIHGVALKGPSTTPDGVGYRSVNVLLRNRLNLYACIRPVKVVRESLSPLKNSKGIDMVIFRENLEDLYAGVEFRAGSEMANRLLKVADTMEAGDRIIASTAVGLKLISKMNTEQLMKKAIEYAIAHDRKKITVVAKANIMKFTDGLFVATCEEVFNTSDTKDLIFESQHIDAVSERIVMKPQDYDVIVTENVYGDILSSLAGGTIGGVLYCPGANMGDNIGVFEATHGTAPGIAGKNIANPVALLLSAEMMLRYLKLNDEANALQKGIEDYFAEEDNASMGTSDIGEYIAGAAKHHISANRVH
jgi:isocitrate dehydrogenase